MKEILDELFRFKDEKYLDFQAALIPTQDKNLVIGVRTPLLRQYAKKLQKSGLYKEFFKELPHTYFEENQLHAFIISEMKDYDECIKALEEFLPYVDNWATCDQLTPKALKKHLPELYIKIKDWVKSGQTYKIRFAIKCLMSYYLEDEFKLEYPKLVASIRSEEYYVNMMISWYFATALAKQWEDTLPFIEGHILSDWCHKKTIQKARESFRISAEQKEYLKGLKN